MNAFSDSTPNQSAAANRGPAGQADGSGDLFATKQVPVKNGTWLRPHFVGFLRSVPDPDQISLDDRR
jgi:hypothetical protein